MTLRGCLSLTGARPPAVVRRIPSAQRAPLLWLTVVGAWLDAAPSHVRALATAQRARRIHAQLFEVACDTTADRERIDAWRDALPGAGFDGGRSDAAALWCAVSVWDDAGGHWLRFARAVEDLARELDGDASTDTARAAMALRERMEAVEARLWGAL